MIDLNLSLDVIPVDNRLAIRLKDNGITHGSKLLTVLERHNIYTAKHLANHINELFKVNNYIETITKADLTAHTNRFASIEEEFDVIIIYDSFIGKYHVYMDMYNDIELYRIVLNLSSESNVIIHEDEDVIQHRILPHSWSLIKDTFLEKDYDSILLFSKIMLDAVLAHAEDVSFDHVMRRGSSGKFFADACIKFKIKGQHVDYNNIKLSAKLQSKMLKDIVAQLCPNSSTDMDTLEGVTTSIADIFCDGSLSLRYVAKASVGGHSCTVRLQNMKTVSLKIDQLGFPLEHQIVLDRLSRKVTGLTLITGSKGSGKNTTAFAIANSMLKYPVKIQDFSSPIEVFMPFAQINYDTSVEKLTHLCRLSKKEATEVIFLNEIPDKSVAFAVQDLVNSSTHVVTTTHIDRVWHFPFKLYELYGEDYRNVISQLNAVINQKMYYKQCKICAERTSIKGIADTEIEKFMASKNLHFHYINKGCPNCDNGTATDSVNPYAEILVLNDEIKSALQQCEKPYEMERYIKQHMLSKNISFEHYLAQAVSNGDLKIDNLITIV